jgi:alpha-ketoglutarate-dependent taurine dioxygenase
VQDLSWRIVTGKPPIVEAPRVDDIESACGWLKVVLPGLNRALRTHGVVFLRGLPMTEVKDFAQVRDVLLPIPTPYREKATPRSKLGRDVFSSTDLPPTQAIQLHNENSYTLTFPGVLLFGCLTAPSEGGATPVADCRKVLSSLPEYLVSEMRSVGWLLTRSYSEFLSTTWQAAFSTEEKTEAERYCKENLIGYQWQADGNLTTRQVRPGIITHPRSGDEVWFNHLAFWNEWALDEELRETLIAECGRDRLPFNTAMGSGRPLTRDEVRVLQDAYAGAAVRETWRKGDLLMVDNILTAHGREPFNGDRKIVVAMGEPISIADCQPAVSPAA